MAPVCLAAPAPQVGVLRWGWYPLGAGMFAIGRRKRPRSLFPAAAQRKRAPEGAPFDDHKCCDRQASLPSAVLVESAMGGSTARGYPWNRRQ